MTKTGRNAPCPCGSGKKFKHCHLAQSASSIIAQPAWREYAEEFVLAGLLAASHRFRLFYDGERARLGQIRWVIDSTLPPGVDGRSTEVDREKYIRLRRIPPLPEDEFLIAHEVAHFLIILEGYPRLGATKEYETLASSISSMVHDPIVHRYLRRHGYDTQLKQECRDEVAKSRAQLKQAVEPTNAIGRAHWAANYASKVIEHVEVYGRRGDDEFLEWFGKRFPNTARMGEEMYALVEQVGFHTPESMGLLLATIVQRFALQRYVVLLDLRQDDIRRSPGPASP